jgi:hypothetical protein
MIVSHWLNASRIRAYPKIILSLYVVIGLCAIGYWMHRVSASRLIISDLTVFWIAAHFALAGHAADAYLPEQLYLAMSQIAPEIQNGYGWFYPPTFFLLIMPLGLMPYWAAYAGFMVGTLTAYVSVLRRVIHGKEAMWCLAAFPGIWINLLTGQNGMLTAALAGAGLLSLRRHPVLAGVLIGMLAIKPHLALLFPVALAAFGAWRTLGVAVFTAIAFLAAGSILLGAETLDAWMRSLALARTIMEGGGTAPMMPTVFAMMRLLHAPLALAYAAHALVACAAAAAVWKVWRSSASFELKGSALMAATLLVSPYLMEYDLAWLGLPIAWMAQTGLQSGWLRGDREILLMAWALPLFTVGLAWFTRLQVGPLCVMALLWAIMHHVMANQDDRRVL